MDMSFQTRRDMLQHVAPQYQQASLAERNTLVNECIAMTGYSRRYGRWLLNHAEAVQQAALCPKQRYGPEVQQALLLAWNTANRMCAKRLIPFLPTLIDALEHHGHLQLSEESRRRLLSMSAVTADRLLHMPRQTSKRGLSTTQAGTLLKSQISAGGALAAGRVPLCGECFPSELSSSRASSSGLFPASLYGGLFPAEAALPKSEFRQAEPARRATGPMGTPSTCQTNVSARIWASTWSPR